MSQCLHHVTPIELAPIPDSMRSAAAAKSNAVFSTQLSLILHLCTQLSLILHLCAHPVWQYTLNAAQPSMNQTDVSILHYRARTPAHSFLKRTTIYLFTHKLIQRSTYTIASILAVRLALCKGIHSNKYRPVKSSQPTPNIPLRLPPKHHP